MRKFKLAVVAVLAATMVFGTTCMASCSPSKSTSVSSSSSSSSSSDSNSTSTVVADPVYLVSGAAKSVAGTQISTDYSGVTDKNYKATALKADAKNPYTVALENYVSTTGAAKKFGPYRVQMYSKGVSMWDGFGTFTFTVGVGNAYDGQTANVYQIHKDGSVTVTPVVVSKGKVSIPVTDLGTFYVAF